MQYFKCRSLKSCQMHECEARFDDVLNHIFITFHCLLYLQAVLLGSYGNEMKTEVINALFSLGNFLVVSAKSNLN